MNKLELWERLNKLQNIIFNPKELDQFLNNYSINNLQNNNYDLSFVNVIDKRIPMIYFNLLSELGKNVTSKQVRNYLDEKRQILNEILKNKDNKLLYNFFNYNSKI